MPAERASRSCQAFKSASQKVWDIERPAGCSAKTSTVSNRDFALSRAILERPKPSCRCIVHVQGRLHVCVLSGHTRACALCSLSSERWRFPSNICPCSESSTVLHTSIFQQTKLVSSRTVLCGFASGRSICTVSAWSLFGVDVSDVSIYIVRTSDVC